MASGARHPPWWSFGSLLGHKSQDEEEKPDHPKWSLGILNDRATSQVPGTVLLLPGNRNEPLGMRNMPSRVSHSSLPVGVPLDPSPAGHGEARRQSLTPLADLRHGHGSASAAKKRTADGAIILDPQPEDSANDPLNWPVWRRNAALLSLGFYCMLGGGMTPVIAAGFTNVAKDYGVSVERVALSTGLYMMGLGVGSVLASPTAILYGKRPVYLASAVLFIGSSLWAGFSPSFSSLLVARIVQGMGVSPVECLPSATIAEIFFLHERAYRIGIYTLLLLGGKNLVPLVSAAIIGRFGWRWVFYIVAMIVAFALILLYLFVPETFWDRAPIRKSTPRPISKQVHLERQLSVGATERFTGLKVVFAQAPNSGSDDKLIMPTDTPTSSERSKDLRSTDEIIPQESKSSPSGTNDDGLQSPDVVLFPLQQTQTTPTQESAPTAAEITSAEKPSLEKAAVDEKAPSINGGSTGELVDMETALAPARVKGTSNSEIQASDSTGNYVVGGSTATIQHFPLKQVPLDIEKLTFAESDALHGRSYTHVLRQRPAQTFVQQLRLYHGRLNNDNWLRVMLRPFILFAYPAVLWSAIIYACSIGWLIVLSENLAIIYRDPKTYNFTAIQAGLVYISPFVGGILGTGVAGKVSDVIVRAMARRNGGLYEPEYRLIMVIPILITTCMGLIGFGWAAEERDAWIVPTVFFGIISFGCSLGSTTSITFCVDSYRQYAGEALVTLNFSKNIFHGLVFSLFVSSWLTHDGARKVYMWLGIIQLVVCLLAVPMYIFGKRARMWTVRRNLMESL